MLAKLFGLGDLLCVLVLIFGTLFPHQMIIWVATLLMFKGLMFAMMRNYVSYVDVGIGIYIVLLSYGVSHWVPTVGSALFLGQKGLLSLI